MSVAQTPIFRDDEVHDTRHEAVIGMESQSWKITKFN